MAAFEIFDEGAGVGVGVHDDEKFVFEEFACGFVKVALAIDGAEFEIGSETSFF